MSYFCGGLWSPIRNAAGNTTRLLNAWILGSLYGYSTNGENLRRCEINARNIMCISTLPFEPDFNLWCTRMLSGLVRRQAVLEVRS